MSADMADAHETARARDAKARAAARHARFMAAIDRILARDPQTAADSTPPAQETPMPTIARTITVRLDPESVALLTEIRNRLPERPTLHTLEDVAAEFGVDLSDDEPADITEEPPAGSQVTDREGDVWEQVGAGWQAWDRTASMWGGRTGWGSSVGPRSYAPLHPTTDADRKRVGLSVDPAPAGERRVNVTITDVYAVPSDYGFLRINVGPETAVIDQNASNVTVTDVEPAPDVDPDEALAKVINAEVVRMARAGDVKIEADVGIAFERNLARAAREHLMARETYTEEGGRVLIDELAETRRRAEKLEADLARVTEERYKWEGRFVALRHDVWIESGSRVAAVAAAAHGILARDTERAES